MRLRMVTILRAHGIKIPNETETVASLKARERELKLAEEAIICEAVAAVTARLGVTPDDARAVKIWRALHALHAMHENEVGTLTRSSRGALGAALQALSATAYANSEHAW